LLVVVALAATVAVFWSSLGARDDGEDAARAPAASPSVPDERVDAELAVASEPGGDAREVADEPEPVDATPEPAADDAPAVADDAPADPGAEVTGVLLDAQDRPCSDVALWLVPGDVARLMTSDEDRRARDGRTDADGRFSFDAVARGTWLIGPRPSLDERVPWGSPVVVPPDVGAVDAVLRLPPELFVSGTTVGPTGEPVGRIHLLASDVATWRIASSDDTGAFRIGPFVAGPVALRADGEAGGKIGTWTGARAVEALAGDEDVLVPVARVAQLRVHVVGEDGAPAPGSLWSSLIDNPEGLKRWTNSRVNDDGVVTLTGLAPGLYRIVARTRDDRAGSLSSYRLDAGADADVVVTVSEAGRLLVLVPRELEARFVRVSIGEMIVGFPRLEGGDEALSKPLPPGEVRVEVKTGDGELLERRATVIAGETIDVAFD